MLQAGQRARTIPLGWGVDSLDWKKPGAPAIVATVLADGVARARSSCCMTAAAPTGRRPSRPCPAIISGLQAAGYTLAAMPPDPGG